MSESDLAEVIGAFNDVTSRLQTSHEALRREVSRLQGELDDANEQIERSRRLAALGEMAAGIAHEVRNPLGSIRLYAKMLEDDLAAMPDQKIVAAKIGAAVRTVDAVVRDVLSFAREERARPEPVDLQALLERTVADVLDADRSERGQGSRDIQVVWPRQSASMEAWCDAVLAQRALNNIIGNAVQAMREHERARPGALTRDGLTLTIEVRRENASPGGRARGSAVQRREQATIIAIGDTGGGVSAEVMERMFNPFFTTRAQGTGLGLAIVHRIMDAHGGSVVVRNRRGPGDVGSGAGAVVELQFPPPRGADAAAENTGKSIDRQAGQAA